MKRTRGPKVRYRKIEEGWYRVAVDGTELGEVLYEHGKWDAFPLGYECIGRYKTRRAAAAALVARAT